MFVGRKGITPIELLVVIVVTTLLLAVLTPGLNRSRQLAVRLLCETNLRGIGSATAAYAGDNDGEFPKSGGPGAIWGDRGTLGPPWKRGMSEEMTFRGDPPEATVSSCLYLLVKYRYAPPKLFHCRGDSGAIAFELSKFRLPPRSIFDCWDFGGDVYLYPGACCSYSYNMPFAMDEFRPGRDPADIINFAIDQMSSEASPVCADRNPYLDENVNVDPPPGGNSAAHRWQGQNVLYKDLHAAFETDPCVGIGSDNIYTFGGDPNTGGGDPEGTPPSDVGMVDAGEHQKGEKDAFLVNELQHWD